MIQANIHELVVLCQQHDERAQFALYDQYKGKMKGLCRRYARSDEDAEDIMQEGPNIQDVRTIHGFMRQIFVRTAINYYNKYLKNYEFVGETPLLFQANEDHKLILSELSKTELLELINSLPDGYRVVFNMYAIDGYAHAEIAEQLGITESTSKSQYSRAKDWLRKKIAEIEMI
jgi:RNA polymerase sigma factor (sigma-70 family)